jgi:hypothetical protein
MPFDTPRLPTFADSEQRNSLQDFNFVSPSGFKLVLDSQKYPNAEFLVQTTSIPQISVNHADFPTPMLNINMPGDKIAYTDLELTFLVDEDFINYREIHDWLIGLVKVQDSKTVKKRRDMSLFILSSHNNPNVHFRFIGAYPLSLSSLSFDATTNTMEYLAASVSFSYDYFEIVPA